MVVRMRANRSHTGNRRSHHALKSLRLSTCKDCGAKHVTHHACMTCGKYNGRVVIDIHAEIEKKEKKNKEKALASRHEAKAPVAVK